MTIGELEGLINGKVLCCEDRRSKSVEYAFASDLMSDVLTIEKENLVLITGLANIQAIRTAEMSEIGCIVFGRDKKVNSEIISLAKENRMVVIESPHSLFHISGVLFKAGLKSVF